MPSVVNRASSRLALFCDALIEAVWLAAICVVPILVKPQGGHAAYQPFKFGFLRIVAIIGLAAWLVRTIEQRSLLAHFRSGAAAFWKSSIAISLLVFGVMIAISTAFSVHWSTSLWGAYETFGGAFTYAGELILFALIAANLRNRGQIERLVTLLLVTSFAVSAYAILQRFGWDPQFPKLEGDRAFGTAGHPIYLAGYLLMSIPLTIYRILILRQGPRATAPVRRAARIFYATVLATQLAAFFCAESRGPILALAVALMAFAVLYASSGHWNRVLSIIGAALLLIVVAIAIAAATSSLKNVPGLRRFAEIQSLQRGVEVFRADIWKEAPQIIFAKKQITHPTDGRIDRWRVLRPWIGYGLETLDSVLPFYYQADVGADFTIENRFHDAVWDLWFAIGAIGLAAFVAAVLFLFYAGYRALGLIGSTTAAAAFWACAITIAAAGVALLTRLISNGFAGVGLVGGLVAGLLIFAVASSFYRNVASISPRPSADRILIVALLAAIAGHLIDTAFAFVTAPTAVLFWTYAGLLVATVRGIEDRQSPTDLRVESAAQTRWSMMAAGLVSIGVVSFLIATIHQFSFQSFSIIDVVARSLCDIEGTDGQHSLLLLPIVLFWISGSFAFVLDHVQSQPRRQIAAPFFGVLLISGAASLAFLLVQTIQLVRIGPIPRRWSGESTALEQAFGHEQLFLVGIATLLVLLAVVAWLNSNGSSHSLGSLRGTLAGALIAVAAAYAIWTGSIKPLRAHVCAGWGEALDETGRQELSAEVYRHAIELDPRPYLYHGLRSEACLKAAVQSSDPARRDNYFAQAERTLLDSLRENDLNRASFFIARLYLVWAENENEPLKTELNRKALTASRQALIFEPHTPPVATLNELAERQVR